MRNKDERLEQIEHRLEEIKIEIWALETGSKYMDMASRVAALEDEKTDLKIERDRIYEAE